MRSLHKEIVAFLILFFVFTNDVNPQCAMCRAVLESGESSTKAEAINDGIVYLMAIPYILVGVVGYAIYRLRFQKK